MRAFRFRQPVPAGHRGARTCPDVYERRSRRQAEGPARIFREAERARGRGRDPLEVRVRLLSITAYGYRPFMSPVYSVPPEVTGLKLRLRPDARQQARLLDPYVGRAGPLRIGTRLARGKRVAGLALRTRGGRLRGVTVKAKRFRTVSGIALGSRETALRDAYTREAAAALAKAKSPATYKVGKATFNVRRGRVVAIVLGR